MNYIEIDTGAYPVSEAAIRAEYPDTSFPSPFVAPARFAPVFPAPQPPHNSITHTVVETAPVETGKGHWEQQWSVLALDAAAAEANIIAARSRIWEAIKAERERRSQYGGYKAAGKWFHSDTFSRSQQIGLVIMGANIPAGLQWKTMDGSFIEMTPALAQQVFQAAAAQDGAIFQHAEQLRSWVDETPDPEVIDITSGWPETFGGV